MVTCAEDNLLWLYTCFVNQLGLPSLTILIDNLLPKPSFPQTRGGSLRVSKWVAWALPFVWCSHNNRSECYKVCIISLNALISCQRVQVNFQNVRKFQVRSGTFRLQTHQQTDNPERQTMSGVTSFQLKQTLKGRVQSTGTSCAGAEFTAQIGIGSRAVWIARIKPASIIEKLS